MEIGANTLLIFRSSKVDNVPHDRILNRLLPKITKLHLIKKHLLLTAYIPLHPSVNVRLSFGNVSRFGTGSLLRCLVHQPGIFCELNCRKTHTYYLYN